MKTWMLACVLSAGLAGALYADGCGGGYSAKSECGSKKSACGVEKKADSAAVEIPTVDTTALKGLIDGGQSLVLVDARTAKWDDGRRLPGALSVSAESTDEQIAQALPDKAARIVTYCSNEKCPASKNLATRLIGLGYQNVSKYPQGLEGWTEDGGQVVNTRAAAGDRT